ncbi:MAG TPA: creatininase family protein [Thermofilaceae archaeon]|nr:creatininase family protein [Thermofilaceae archaeon]
MPRRLYASSMSGEVMRLGELTWEEAGRYLKTADFVILPTGSFEQHGPHLPLLTDSIRAEALAEELARKAEERGLRVLLLPVLTYGVSEHHMNFPGTISIDSLTYISLIEDIGRSLARHGVRRLVLLNFHGGNIAPLQVAVERIRVRYGLRTYLVHWTSYARDAILEVLKPSGSWGHACEHETSMIMLFRPELVRKDRIRVPKVRKRADVKAFYYFDEITDTGGLGDPTKASAEKAKVIVERATERIVEVLESIKELEISDA